MSKNIYKIKNSYKVDIIRNGERLSRNFKTLEEAEEIRDDILNIYNSTGKLPHVEKEKNISNNIRKTKGNKYIVEIKRDNKVLARTFDTLEEAEEIRDDILNIYNSTGKMPIIERERNEHGGGSVTKTPSDTYLFKVIYKKKRLNKTFKTKKEAEYFRYQVTEFLKETKRLPTKAEIELILLTMF